MNSLLKLGASLADAEDIAHETLIAALLRQAAGDELDYETWMLAVARSRFFTARQQLVYGLTVESILGDEPDRTTDGPEDRAIDQDLARILVARLHRLSPVTVDVCRLLNNGVSRPMVTRLLGLSARAIESHLTRARRVLRTYGHLCCLPLVAVAIPVSSVTLDVVSILG